MLALSFEQTMWQARKWVKRDLQVHFNNVASLHTSTSEPNKLLIEMLQLHIVNVCDRCRECTSCVHRCMTARVGEILKEVHQYTQGMCMPD